MHALPTISAAAMAAIQQAVEDERPVSDLEWLGLSPRALQRLNEAGIVVMGDLMTKKPSEILGIESFGEKSIHQLFEALSRYHELDTAKERHDPKMFRRLKALGGG